MPSHRRFCRNSLSTPWGCGGLQISGRTASLSASQYFNIIVLRFLVCEACFHPLGCHPCPWAWRVRPPLFRFNPFSLSLELLPLLYLAISWDILEPTFSLLLPLSLLRPLVPLEVTPTSSSSPPLSHSSFPFHCSFPYHLMPASYIS